MRVRLINGRVPLTRKKKRVCAYARVSTDSRHQEDSLENQQETYERQIKANPEYEFAGVYADQGISGYCENRPEFQKMLEAARAGEIDLIITKSISRFARNTVTLLETVRELKALGLKVEGQYGIGLNGAAIYEADTGKIIHKTLMKPEAVRTMVEIGRGFSDRMNVQLYTGGEVYVERWDETTDYYEKATGSHPKLVDNLLDYVNEAIKIVFFHNGEFDYTLDY